MAGYEGSFEYYVITDVLYDGDCMFTCLAIGLPRESASIVREEIVTYLRLHPDTVCTRKLEQKVNKSRPYLRDLFSQCRGDQVRGLVRKCGRGFCAFGCDGGGSS